MTVEVQPPAKRALPSRRTLLRCGLGALVVVLALAVAAVVFIRRPAAGPFELTVQQHFIIGKLESVLLHDTATLQYDRIEDRSDGRGYTTGRGDFSTAGGEVLAVVEQYALKDPDNALQQFLPALRQLANDHASSHQGLDSPAPFVNVWRGASSDAVFQQVQDEAVDRMYLDPALSRVHSLGLHSPLAVAILLDATIQHGDATAGADPDGVGALVTRTNAAAGGTPAQGVDERTWLAAFLQTRRATLLMPHGQPQQTRWAESVGRVDALRGLLDSHNDALRPPLTVSPYGRPHVIELGASEAAAAQAGGGASHPASPAPSRSAKPSAKPSSSATPAPSQAPGTTPPATTPPVATTTTPPVPPVNRAPGAVASANSSCNSTEGAAKAVDGSTGTKWCSYGTSRWLRLDLGASYQVSSIVIRHAEAGGESSTYNTRDYDLQTSTDGNSWTTVASTRGNRSGTTTNAFSAPVPARYVRLNVIAGEQSEPNQFCCAARIYEVEVWA